MKRKRRSIETLNLSFLDAISCGFGAVILLLVIAKIYEPIRLEESAVELDLLVARYEEELQKIIGETNRLERERQSTSDQVVLAENQIDVLRRRLTEIRSSMLEQRDDAEFSNEL
ncbi:MAG TPA: VWA domain-containing protein, partial [Gammaproteobacteria bacterium]|nr:VWA domain-containing protein [Gammaproteobacteria bacterium]